MLPSDREARAGMLRTYGVRLSSRKVLLPSLRERRVSTKSNGTWTLAICDRVKTHFAMQGCAADTEPTSYRGDIPAQRIQDVQDALTLRKSICSL